MFPRSIYDLTPLVYFLATKARRLNPMRCSVTTGIIRRGGVRRSWVHAVGFIIIIIISIIIHIVIRLRCALFDKSSVVVVAGLDVVWDASVA